MDIHVLLICGIFLMPVAVILAMGAFWVYIWVKEQFGLGKNYYLFVDDKSGDLIKKGIKKKCQEE